jgi:hypothetical protein
LIAIDLEEKFKADSAGGFHLLSNVDGYETVKQRCLGFSTGRRGRRFRGWLP